MSAWSRFFMSFAEEGNEGKEDIPIELLTETYEMIINCSLDNTAVN
jgi:hypothetical protein